VTSIAAERVWMTELVDGVGHRLRQEDHRVVAAGVPVEDLAQPTPRLADGCLCRGEGGAVEQAVVRDVMHDVVVSLGVVTIDRWRKAVEDHFWAGMRLSGDEEANAH